MTPDAKRTYMAAWYQRNKARLSVERKDYLAAYYQEHKERAAEVGRAYRESNAEHVAAQKAAYRATPEARAKKRAWDVANIDKRREAKRLANIRSRDTRRNYDFRKKFGITLTDYDRMLDDQGGLCAVCFGPPNGNRKLAVDHDHTTGAIRGLLCNSCNLAAGKLRESPEIVASLYVYMTVTA